jgi:microcystin-dependent protein
MGLETANYIADLVTTNPLSADVKSQGDDHIRMLKAVLQNTFPGVGGRFARVATKNSGYTVASTDNTVLLDCTSALTLAITAAATLGNGFVFSIYASGGAVTIDPYGTETINGATTYTLPQGCLGIVWCSGTAFTISSNYIPLSQLERSGTAGQVLTSNGTLVAPSMQNLPIYRPAGEIAVFAMNSAPAGWLAADGSNVSRATYSSLFSAIGTTYGIGDGTTTFTLPDLRGYFVRGAGTNGDGVASGTFAAKQADAYLNHTHGVTESPHSHTQYIPAVTTYADGTNTARVYSISTLTTTTTASASTGLSVNTSTTGGSETRPRNIAMLYCIKT